MEMVDTEPGLDTQIVGGLTLRDLASLADAARVDAYAPYSGLSVGAALLADTGEVFQAVNVENGSYSLTICAERAAVVQAVSAGVRSFAAIAVAGDTERVETFACCGACLQVLAEFDPDHRLLVAFPDRQGLRVATLKELLPTRFQLRE
jgi:cytidine deaminase